MTIVINQREYLQDFVALNEAWISRYFKLEAVDHELARNPGKIIDAGGYILILLSEDKAVGTCALFKESEDTYQLARMAVDPVHQGKGYGDILISAAMNTLHEVGAQRVYLLSNTILAPAIGLYRKHGFMVKSEGQHPVYARCNIVMEKQL